MLKIIDKIYAHFSEYRAPQTFEVCTACCLAEAEILQLTTLPLRTLSQALICRYNISAKPTYSPKAEVAYLLPRMLELLAQGEEINSSYMYSLNAISTVKDHFWTMADRTLFDEFALQYMHDLFNTADKNRQLFLLEAICVMFAHAKINLPPLLDTLIKDKNIYAIFAIACLVGGEYIDPELAENCPQVHEELQSWFVNNRQRLQDLARLNIPSQLIDDLFVDGFYSHCIKKGLQTLSMGMDSHS